MKTCWVRSPGDRGPTDELLWGGNLPQRNFAIHEQTRNDWLTSQWRLWKCLVNYSYKHPYLTITPGNDFSSFHCNPLFLKARGVAPQSSSCWKPGYDTGCTLLLTVQWFHMWITSKHLSEYQIFLTFHCIFYPFMLKVFYYWQ